MVHVSNGERTGMGAMEHTVFGPYEPADLRIFLMCFSADESTRSHQLLVFFFIEHPNKQQASRPILTGRQRK